MRGLKHEVDDFVDVEIRDDDDNDDIEFLEVLARTQDDAPQSFTAHSINPFVSLYEAHPELELERNSLAQVCSSYCRLIPSSHTLLAA